MAYPANTYSREYLENPHPKTGKQYSIAELKTYLEELQQSAAKPVRKQTAAPSAEEELFRQENTSFQFLTRHIHDFNNCKANVEMIKEFFQEHQLEWSLENLERAFSRLKSKLAPVPGAAVNTPQPSAPEPPPPVPVPVVQPAVEPIGLAIEEINSWDAPTLRKKMADPVTRKQIDLCLAAEAELRRLSQRQIQRQQMRGNQ